MGLFVVSLRKHTVIRLFSFLCLYASLLCFVVWSTIFRDFRCTIASVGVLIATVMGHAITRVSIRLRLIVLLLFVDTALLLIVSVVSLYRAIRVDGNVASESIWTFVVLCLLLQMLMFVLVAFGVSVHPFLSVLPTLCLFALSVIGYLVITVIRSLRVFCRKE